MLDDRVEQARAGSAGKRRGRRAAPPAGPRGPVEQVSALALAVLAAGRERVWMPLAERIAPARERVRERGGAAYAAFTAGPVLPWVSAHRMAVLVGGALLVSAIAMGGAAAMIASTAPVAGVDDQAVDDQAVDGGERPRPGSEFTMPSPAPSSDAPKPSSPPTPEPTSTPTPAPGQTAPGTTDPSTDPEPTTDPEEPTGGIEDDAPGNSGNSPGADNRPEKDKG
jgi:hypothetical protein